MCLVITVQKIYSQSRFYFCLHDHVKICNLNVFSFGCFARFTVHFVGQKNEFDCTELDNLFAANIVRKYDGK